MTAVFLVTHTQYTITLCVSCLVIKMDTLNNHHAVFEQQFWNKEAAMNRLGGNEGLLNRIVEMFLAQIAQKQQALHKAVSEQDIEGVRFTSHAMKGVSGDVGADAVREKASSIENKAKRNDLTDIAQDIQELDSLIEHTIEVMRSSK